MSEEQKCVICDNRLVVSWAIAHGVAHCCTCRILYTIYHFDENGKREDKPPKVWLKDEAIPLFRQCWQEIKEPIMDSFGNFYMPVSDWLDAHCAEAQNEQEQD